MSSQKLNVKKITTISSKTQDYKNIRVIEDELSDKNTHAIVYDNGTELTRVSIRLDSEQPFRTISGIDGRKYDNDKRQYIDGTKKGEWSTTLCIYNKADKPTKDEKDIETFLDKLNDHIINEYAKSLKSSGKDKSKKMGKNIISHEDVVNDSFSRMVKPSIERNGKIYSPTMTLKHPFSYGDNIDKIKSLTTPDEKKPFRQLMNWRYVDQYGDNYDLDRISPEQLKKNSKMLYLRPYINPERITYGDGSNHVKTMVNKLLCYEKSYTGATKKTTENDFPNAKPFNEEEDGTSPDQHSLDEHIDEF